MPMSTSDRTRNLGSITNIILNPISIINATSKPIYIINNILNPVPYKGISFNNSSISSSIILNIASKDARSYIAS
jgi:hypothetical protein